MVATKMFVALTIFYVVFIALVGLVPQTDIVYCNEYNVTETEDTVCSDATAPPTTGVDFIDSIIDFFNIIFVRITGFPAFIQAIFFTPLGIFAIYWLVKLVGWALPFVGG